MKKYNFKKFLLFIFICFVMEFKIFTMEYDKNLNNLKQNYEQKEKLIKLAKIAKKLNPILEENKINKENFFSYIEDEKSKYKMF